MEPKTSELSSMATPAPATKHYSVELRYVRALCLHTEYRKCVQTCRDLLQTAEIQSQPIQMAFLLFYSALAHDEMARAMHHNSTVKVPALNNAEQLYLAALHALPSPEDAEMLCAELIHKSRAETLEPGEVSPSLDGYDPFVPDKASLATSPLRLRRECFSIRSSAYSPTTTAISTSDLDDLESHDSFSELLTPNRVLNRDYSRMSFLETTPSSKRELLKESGLKGLPAPARMQRDFSRMSLIATPPHKPNPQGLLLPHRPVSPPKQFYIPPRLPNTSKIPLAKTGKPILNEAPCHGLHDSITSIFDSLSRQQPGSEPVSPISRRDSGRYSSNASTVSAISPLTPTRSRHDSVSSDIRVQDGLCLRLNDHLNSMRMQMETHIALVQKAKEQLRVLQSDRALARVVSTVDTSSKEGPANAYGASRQANRFNDQGPLGGSDLRQARSYWSFVPEDVKLAEKQRRMRAGRERQWERKTERFDARKYQDLCERALDELCLKEV